MFYFVKTPAWLTWLYPQCTWQMPSDKKIIYLTFDDGPHPEVTPFVLNELKKYDAKATFFCIGKNVAAYPSLYAMLAEEGHRTGNHTYDHLNGWKTTDEVYLDNINHAKRLIGSSLFRPPYGRIGRSQLRKLSKEMQVVMWTVLSGDFDQSISPEKCLLNVTSNADNGSVVVFHDSEKAFSKLRFVLPRVLEFYSEKGYMFRAL